MKPCQLDTDTLSEVLKGRNPLVLERAETYLSHFGNFTFSLIMRYEILRGLKAKKASKQLARFDEQCRRSRIMPINDEVVVRAADFYARLRGEGQLISDADLFIAATALIHDLILVTNNTDHFRRIPGLIVDSWSA